MSTESERLDRELAFPPRSGVTWNCLRGSNLCDFCNTMLFDLRLSESDETTCTRVQSITENGESGCLLCRALRRASAFSDMVKFQSAAGDRALYITLRRRTETRVVLQPLHNFTRYPEGGYISLGLSIEPKSIFTVGHSAPLSNQAASFILDQFSNCLTNPHHQGCRPRDADPRTPSRVLEIIGSTVALVDFLETMRGEYATLSYCWGSPFELHQNPPYKATASNLATLRSGIPLTELPLTIRQAVYVCKYLGLRYIWVDSLCILQDSSLDWQVEAAKMGAIYHMSKITIIAASSKSCHSGFLSPDSFSQSVYASDDLAVRITARVSSSSGFHKGQTWGTSDPLDARGWAYHEEMVSTRYIKFGSDDIQWKCKAGSICLCGGTPEPLYTEQWPETTNQWKDRWDYLVNAIAKRHFTDVTDILPALASLAEKVAHLYPLPLTTITGEYQQRYLAGLWRRDLLRQLCWFRHGTARLPGTYVAPSFSWASVAADPACGDVDGMQIQFPWGHRNSEGLTKVVSASTDLIFQEGEFGKVSGGHVSVRGPVLRCHLSYRPGKGVHGSAHVFCRSHQLSLQIQPDTPEFQVVGTITVPARPSLDCPVVVVTTGQQTQSLERSQAFGGAGFQDVEVAVLIVGRDESQASLYEYGLPGLQAIMMVQNRQSPGYQRIGYVKLEILAKLLSQNSQTLEEILQPFAQTVTIY
ncbi:heterokaryon incompatibility protein-domain-containing protein [Podospora aff. communis PSN243]|uniref:Heterokaryon incompatibility protein-domain-containing protein n=1 Tax=Podospora aff. communis PSN243 TaxID=3040156 RepID=A0AAV9GER4_9PEZI|nr:heterokaryon incompatibility protein-domain-containing protein [Podospora aff. communis PSN243]